MLLLEWERRLGKSGLRSVAVTVLGWLKTPLNRPLMVDPAHNKGQALYLMAADLREFAEILEVKHDRMAYRAEVSLDERKEIREFVKANYKPKLMVYYKPKPMI